MPICEYCNSDISTLHNLKRHQQTNKKCLQIQKDSKIEEINEQIHKCDRCDKTYSSKQYLRSHVCTIAKERIDILLDRIKILENEIKVLKDQNENLTNKLIDKLSEKPRGTIKEINISNTHNSQIDIKENTSNHKEKSRKSIPKALRNSVWTQYNGNKFDGKCYSCKRDIDILNFIAGHIQSLSHGGDTTLSNLRPICLTCNSSMGATNMEEFISTFMK